LTRMSGRSRRWVCCSAAAFLVALSGWRVAETSASAWASLPVHTLGAVADEASLHDRQVVAEPPTAKRVEIERLVSIMVAAAVILLVALNGGLAAAGHPVRGRRDRWRVRSRGPPLALVSRP